MNRRCAAALLLAACAADTDSPVEVDLSDGDVTRQLTIDGERAIRIRVPGPTIVEAWAEGGAFADVPTEQLAAGASAAWLAPRPITGELEVMLAGDGEITLTAWPRGAPPPPTDRDRSLAWFDPELLDDPATVSLGRILDTIAADGDGGRLLDRWFRAFAAGPGAGRATFMQFLDEVIAQQGPDASSWDLAQLPFRVTGVHARHDLARGADCGELRVSIASMHPTFAPVHLLFLFRIAPAPDDRTSDGVIHCRGAARRWARLSALDGAAWRAEARAILDAALVRQQFALAESVELSISPWQWRQWVPDLAGGLTNPPLFQTVDVDLANAPGPARDALLAAVAADPAAVAARAWAVPIVLRSAVAEVQPDQQAALVDLSPLPEVLAAYPDLPRAIGMVGCPRCHTDAADFVQTSVERRPSPFYDRELDARAARLDALNRGEWPVTPAFGPLQPL